VTLSEILDHRGELGIFGPIDEVSLIVPIIGMFVGMPTTPSL